MNLFFVLAALLLFVLALVHSFLGEKLIISRVLALPQPELMGSDKNTKKILRYAWHVTSLTWIGCGVLVLFLSDRLMDASIILMADVMAVVFLGHAIYILVASRAKHAAWFLFALVSLCLFWGSRFA